MYFITYNFISGLCERKEKQNIVKLTVQCKEKLSYNT